jgi:uncharacterized FAD-dependent dehydrogenase
MLQNQERLRLYEFQGIQLAMNTSNKGLYPCGEGAGYAGGSQLIDGEKCAVMIGEV